MPLPGIMRLFYFIINKLRRSGKKIKPSVPWPHGSRAVYVSGRKTVANINDRTDRIAVARRLGRRVLIYAFRRREASPRRHSGETMASVGVNGRRSSVGC